VLDKQTDFMPKSYIRQIFDQVPAVKFYDIMLYHAIYIYIAIYWVDILI